MIFTFRRGGYCARNDNDCRFGRDHNLCLIVSDGGNRYQCLIPLLDGRKYNPGLIPLNRNGHIFTLGF